MSDDPSRRLGDIRRPAGERATVIGCARYSPLAIGLIYDHLVQSGFDERTAGNLVAIDMGLEPVGAGWTLPELISLSALRSMYRAGLLDSPTPSRWRWRPTRRTGS